MNINKQGSTVQRKHTKREEKVKLDKEAHQDARQNVKLLLGTKHVTRDTLNNFAPENFWGGAKFVTMNTPQKFQEC